MAHFLKKKLSRLSFAALLNRKHQINRCSAASVSEQNTKKLIRSNFALGRFSSSASSNKCYRIIGKQLLYLLRQLPLTEGILFV